MENADFAERFNGWRITEEQITEIKAGNAQAIAAFISDNLRRVRAMAFSFLSKRHSTQRYAGYEIADLLNQLFVDLPHLRFKDGRGLWSQIRACFRCVPVGGFVNRNSRDVSCRVSVDSPAFADDDGGTLADFIPDRAPSPLERVEQAETVEESAPEILACLSDVLKRSKGACGTESTLRAVVEYVFAGYTFAQVKRFAGVCNA